jgi:hypothetical protein
MDEIVVGDCSFCGKTDVPVVSFDYDESYFCESCVMEIAQRLHDFKPKLTYWQDKGRPDLEWVKEGEKWMLRKKHS